ncbi:MAG: OmpA family protein [Bacteroidetes bacterium]|nr:OmpA family protein [Bacteroidota bacterium]
MRIPLWILALVFAGYTVWAVNYWHCYKCHCCNGETPVAESKTTGEPLFKWGADQPVPDAKFAEWKKAFLAKGGQGDTLLITGLYRAKETNTSKFANLGLARANALRAMMMPEMPESRIHVAGKLIEPDSLTENSDPRPSADWSWRKMVLRKEEGAIIESDNAVTFLFPFNSTEKDKDPAVDAYLTKLVEKHKNTQFTFSVIGHTDNVGEDQENKALGLGRAKAIAKFLIDNGIAANRIQTDSKGETEPIADNNTEDGRHQNRRVVLTVNR